MGKILHVPAVRWSFLLNVVVLLLGSVSLFYFQFVKVKMLPFDNKSEFQVIVDMRMEPLSNRRPVPQRPGASHA